MNVGVCKVTLQIPENQTLKGKRRVIASLCQRIRNNFRVAAAEVDNNDVWQIATLGISCVSGSARHAEETLQSVIDYIESSRDDVVVLDVERQIITGV